MAVELDDGKQEESTTLVPEPGQPMFPNDEDGPVELLNEILAGKKLVVDTHLWHKLAYLIMTHPEDFSTGAYTPQARLLMLGRVRVGSSAGLKDCEKLWAETKAHIARG